MNKLLDKKIIELYVVIELIIFGVIKYLEITSQFNFKMCVAKYMAIVVDFIVATCIWLKYRKGEKPCWDDLIYLGLVGVFIADFILTFLALVISNKIWGFAIFCTVQLIFCIYMKPGKINIIIRAIVLIILWVIIAKINRMNPENATGMFNISLVVVNMVYSWFQFSKNRSRKNLLFALGMTCFAICDVSLVGRAVATGLVNTVFLYIVWTAYVPAILLLTFAYAQSVADKK